MTAPNWANRTMWTGDNLDIMRGMNSESVDLIYLDPPFDKMTSLSEWRTTCCNYCNLHSASHSSSAASSPTLRVATPLNF